MMRLKVNWFLSVCVVHCASISIYAQGFEYRPVVPSTIGASDAPAVIVKPVPAFPPPMFMPPPAFPPPPMPSPPEQEDKLPSSLRLPVAPDQANNILNFWLGELANPSVFPDDKVSLWFSHSPEAERQIRENFYLDVLNAMRGEYNQWRETPRGRLALIILLDQLTRHFYHNKPQSFMSDRMAQALALEGLQKGDDRFLYPIEKAFFYLPLQHAENLQLQNLSVAYYRQLLEESPFSLKPQMNSFLQSALMRQQQIVRFGRFPHRNTILERESTPEEAVFLNQWGKSSF